MPRHTIICAHCGAQFSVKPSRFARGNVQYCSLSCHARAAVGPRGKHWRGGRTYNEKGYVVIRVGGQDVLEHRYVMEQAIGRPLREEEVVHHISGVKDDNRIENLQLMTRESHGSLHAQLRPKSWGGGYDRCVLCGTTERKHSGRGLCTSCYRRTRPKPAAPLSWSINHDRCVECGTTNRRHHGFGLCNVCYKRWRKSGQHAA